MSGEQEPGEDNPDLAAVQRGLVALVRRLEASMDLARTPAEVDALADRIVEVNARATEVGGLLLAARTEEIRRSAAKVGEAIERVEGAIDDLADLQAFAAGVTTLLGAVDRAIGLARRA